MRSINECIGECAEREDDEEDLEDELEDDEDEGEDELLHDRVTDGAVDAGATQYLTTHHTETATSNNNSATQPQLSQQQSLQRRDSRDPYPASTVASLNGDTPSSGTRGRDFLNALRSRALMAEPNPHILDTSMSREPEARGNEKPEPQSQKEAMMASEPSAADIDAVVGVTGTEKANAARHLNVSTERWVDGCKIGD